MRVLIAPDKFKGTLTAPEAADAIAGGVRRATREHGFSTQIDLCPVADGGEGTVEIVADALRSAGAFVMDVQATDLLGAPVTARCVRWAHGGGGFTTLIESAQVIGLSRVPPDRRDPMAYHSGALGELIREVGADARGELIVALGGSATVDGGVGMARALGWRVADDFVGGPGPGALRPRVTALCDVNNPLLGERGAARVYGPQKGATPGQIEKLERGLAHLVEVCRRAGIRCDPNAPGAGAAGGLGFGLASFLGAELVPGAGYLLDLMGFDARVSGADLVITGEGCLDAQTLSRKAPMEVASRARQAGRPVLAFVGGVRGGASWEGVFDGVWACGRGEAGDARDRLEGLSARAIGEWFCGRAWR